MSIFKQTFPEWVRNQLKVRQNLQGKGFKNSNALTWNQNKQCVIRATSLVDYRENVGLDITNGVSEIDFKSLAGPELAKRFILQGGIFNNGNTRSNTFGKVGSAYGDPTISSHGDNVDGFGQVPMPGITSLDIKTKSAYGSLRQAKLSFVVHNLKQLEVMEMLYMRPGYPVLVEWGWSPFIGNDGEISTEEFSVASVLERTTGKKDPLFSDKLKQQDLYSAIIKLKQDTFGNADAFMGFVTNFGYQARPDGGFDCYSELVSMGEAIDSIKIRPIKNALLAEFGDIDLEFKVEETEEEIKNPDSLKAIILALAKFTGVIGTGGAEEEWLPQFLEFNDNSGQLVAAILSKINTTFLPILEAEDKALALEQYILRKYQTTQAGDFSAPLNTGYIRWDLFAHLINEIVIPKSNGAEPAVKIVQEKLINNPLTNKKENAPLFYNSFKSAAGPDITDLSCDPSICILPHSWFDTSLQNTIGAESYGGKFLESITDGITSLYNRTTNSIANIFDNEIPDIDDISTNVLSQKMSEKYIGGIYLNTEMLQEAYDDSIRGQKDADLGAFMKSIWDKVNEACPLHNFVFKIDDEFSNQAYVIDLPIDNEEIAEIKDEIFVVEVQSDKSVVREYSLEATIPDALKSTVAVHAQSPGSSEDIDDVTFNAFNRCISNRLFIPPPPPIDETAEEAKLRIEQERAKAQQKSPEEQLIDRYTEAYYEFEKYKKVYFEIVNFNANDEVSDADDRVSDLKTTLKTLQTTALEIESFYLKNISTSAVIPLEFNLTFDGISNILIGCIFKIKEDRLPRAYRSNNKGGANVGFIVFNEEQSITAGQDWTTKIGGKMIMLPNENQGKSAVDGIPALETALLYDPNLVGNEGFDIGLEQQTIPPEINKLQVGDPIYVKINGVITESGEILLQDKNGNPQGYTYVRESAEVNNDSGVFDFFDNVIGAIPPGNKGLLLGTITEIVEGPTPISSWYKFEMSSAALNVFIPEFTNTGEGNGDGSFGPNNSGWVRSDTIQTGPPILNPNQSQEPVETESDSQIIVTTTRTILPNDRVRFDAVAKDPITGLEATGSYEDSRSRGDMAIEGIAKGRARLALSKLLNP